MEESKQPSSAMARSELTTPPFRMVVLKKASRRQNPERGGDRLYSLHLTISCTQPHRRIISQYSRGPDLSQNERNAGRMKVVTKTEKWQRPNCSPAKMGLRPGHRREPAVWRVAMFSIAKMTIPRNPPTMEKHRCPTWMWGKCRNLSIMYQRKDRTDEANAEMILIREGVDPEAGWPPGRGERDRENPDIAREIAE